MSDGVWAAFHIVWLIGAAAIGWLLCEISRGGRRWWDGYREGYNNRDAEHEAILAQIRLHQAKQEGEE